MSTNNTINIPKFEFESLEYLFAFFFKIQRKYNTTTHQNVQWFVDNIYSAININNNILLNMNNVIIPELHFTVDTGTQFVQSVKIYIGREKYDFNLLPNFINMYSNLFPNENRIIPFNVNLQDLKGFINHRNCLVYDKKEKKAYYFEPHGSYFYESLKYKWVTEKVFCILHDTLKNHGIEVIPPYVTTPYINGLQSIGDLEYKKNELEGYCMLWSSFIIFILHYTNLPEIDTSLNIQKIVNYSRVVYTNNCSTDNLIVQRIIQGFWLFLNNNKIKQIFENYTSNLVPVVKQTQFDSPIPFNRHGCLNTSVILKSIVSVRSLNGECRDKNLTIHYSTRIPRNINPSRIDVQRINQTFGSNLIIQTTLPDTYEQIFNEVNTIKNNAFPNEQTIQKENLISYELTSFYPKTVLSSLFNLYNIDVSEEINVLNNMRSSYEFGGVIMKCQLFLQIINFLCSPKSEGVIHFPYRRNDQMIYFINNTIDDLQKILYAYNITHDCKYHVEHELRTEEFTIQ